MTAAAPDAPIGPGRLVLVVGPSGAGKDTLINGARAACRSDPGVVFPRRVVTRPSSAAEDHDTVTQQAFDRQVTDGAFALWWDAHGNRYGIPSSIDDALRCGRTVVCNVSRTVTQQARRRYANVVVVLVTAPPEVLAARLAGRQRSSDGDAGRRIARSVEVDGGMADVVVDNVGDPEIGIRRLLGTIGRSVAAD